MTAGAPPQSSRIFVGRERELEALRAALDDACAAHGRLVLLVGDPGIGKTRTTEELAAVARERGALVLVGRCYDGEGAPPYWPWVLLLRAYARAVEPATAAVAIGSGGADIARVIESWTQALPTLPTEHSLAADQARFRFFDGLTTFLQTAARRRPLVLILDDLHWADHASLLLLQFLAREIADTALLILGTYRDVVDRHHPFLDTLAELAREPASRLLHLRGLAEQDVAAFMTGAGSSAPPAALVRTVHQRTDGNPFFIGQLVRLLAPEGAWPPSAEVVASAIPSGVHEVIATRLNRLSPACLQLLRTAAVAGREFDLRVLATVAAQPIDALLAPLDEAVHQRLVAEVSAGAHGYSFSHALIRDELYGGLGAHERIALHRATGEALEALYPSVPETRLAELAYHFCEAMPGGSDVDKAITYARRAANHAKASLADEEAVRCYDLALRLLAQREANEPRHQRGAGIVGLGSPRQVPEIHEASSQALECDLLLALGEAHHNTGNRAAAREAYARAAAIARRLGHAEMLARAALGYAGIVIGVAVDQDSVALLDEALAALGPHDSGLRAMLLARLAMELFFAPSPERRSAASADAIATAQRAGDVLAMVHAFEARHFAVWGPDSVVERLALADEMIRWAAVINNVDLVMHGHNLRIGDLLELGRIEAVDAAIAEYARLAAELRQPSYRWGVGMCRAMRALMGGRFDEAEELATTALMLGQRVQAETAANFFAAHLFFLRRDQGRLAELTEGLQQTVAAFPTVPAWRCALAGLYAATGRREDAARELEHVSAADFRDIPRDNSWLVAMTMLADACARLHDQQRAALLYEALLPYRELVVVAGIAAACGGAVTHSLGLLATTLERWDSAAAHFDDALAVHRRLGARPAIARTQLAYAVLLFRSTLNDRDTNRERARTLIDAARSTAKELGMATLAADAEALLQAGGTPPRMNKADIPDPAFDPGENIFSSEADHWMLVFEGRTCRLKDAKGLHYIAALLHEPHRPMHVGELERSEDRETAPVDAVSRDQLRNLCAELDEAERFNDIGNADRLRAAIEELSHTLARELGLDSSPSKQADLLRLRVTKAIKAAVRKISTQHPALGHHLDSTIRTGSFCTYVPDPTKPIRWRL